MLVSRRVANEIKGKGARFIKLVRVSLRLEGNQVMEGYGRFFHPPPFQRPAHNLRLDPKG